MGDDTPLIDVRPDEQFLAGHLPGAVGIPLEQLTRRVHELPPRAERLRVFDVDTVRAIEAAQALRNRGHPVTVEKLDSGALSETGRSRTRLWQPNRFLVEALQRIREDSPPAGRSSPRALDVACGTGRDAVYLALNGYQVQAFDLLPDALERAADLALRNGVRIETICRDLERDPHLPNDGFDLVTVFRFLHRPLFGAVRKAVAPGGYVVYETFHEATRATGRKPTSPDHLLKTGELREAFADFEVLIARDCVESDGRFVSSLLARRRGGG